MLITCGLFAAEIDSLRTMDKLPSAVKEVTTENRKDKKVKLRFDTRIDGMYNTFGQRGIMPEGSDKQSYGFAGKYINLLVFGNITDKLSYSFSYRMNLPHIDPVAFFSTIDWMNLTYDINKNWFISGGKQMLYIGGWEYDMAPIDIHFASHWWNNTPSIFQFGVSGGYRSNDGNHTLYLQFANSQFSEKLLSEQFYYGLSWYGNMGVWKTIYSVNFMEYKKGKFINYISLGNKFQFDNCFFYVDWMNRAASTEKFFSNFSLIGKFQYDINEKVSVFAKGGLDQNLSQSATTDKAMIYDSVVLPGTQRGYYGAGVEYTPLINKKHALRLHAFWYGTTDEYMPQSVNIGIKWQMNVIE